MKKAILACSILCFSSAALAQQKIGNNATVIDFASILELEHPNKALYLTRVALTSTTDILTVPSPKAGMVVYNTNVSITGIGAAGAGLYYYNGAFWASANASTGGLSWLITGNSGTIDGTNFIGTTDAVPFNIRVNNVRAGRIEMSPPGNTSYGYGTLQSNVPNITTGAGSYNTAMGGYALNANSSGGRNAAFGYDALGANQTGDSNAAFGFGALQVNTTGFNNTATGAYSLNHNTSGKFNTAVGYEALLSNTVDSGSTAVGAYALYYSNGGKANTAMGLGALFLNLAGSSNTAIGSAAMRFNVLGSDNTAVGFQAGNTNGASNNTFVGSNSDGTTPALSWSGAIGSNAKVSVSNALTLGATDAGSSPTNPQSVYVGINVTNPTQRIDFRNGHLRNRQDVAPTISVTSAFGVTNAVLNTGSSDVRGQIIATGINNAGGYSIIHVNFTYTCTNIPYITITAANETAAFNNWYVNATTTGFDLYYRAPYPGLSNTTGAVYNYHVIE